MPLSSYVVWGAIVLIVTGVAGVTVVMVTKPDTDTIALMGAMFASIITVAMALLTSLRAVHVQMNSRMDDLLKASSAAGWAEGQIEGRAVERREGKEATVVIEADSVDVTTTDKEPSDKPKGKRS